MKKTYNDCVLIFEKQTTLTIIKASRTILPTRDQFSALNEGYFEKVIIGRAMLEGVHELHIGDAIQINTIVQVGNCKTVLMEIHMSTKLYLLVYDEVVKNVDLHSCVDLF